MNRTLCEGLGSYVRRQPAQCQCQRSAAPGAVAEVSFHRGGRLSQLGQFGGITLTGCVPPPPGAGTTRSDHSFGGPGPEPGAPGPGGAACLRPAHNS